MVEDDPDHTRVDDATLLDDSRPFEDGSDVVLCGRYRLGRLIGSGGMAQVWSGTDTVLGRQVAVKILHRHLASDETFVARFRAEAIAAARLSHQNIVGVFDTCSDGDREAIVMELLNATTLRQHLDRHHTLEVATTVRIALRVLSALEAAHQAGLIHRDVKPSNILLCDDGRVKIADFGIAKVDDHSDLTQTGSLIGTAAYFAPEQVTEDPVDARTDIYALGIVMYECLTGKTPFRADSKAATAIKRLHVDPVDPRRIRTGVPPELARTIMKALERNPDDRFESAADLRAALLDAPVPPTLTAGAHPDDTGELPAVTSSFSRSERRWLLPAVVLVLVAVALTTVGLLVNESTRTARTGQSTTTSSLAPAAALSVARALPFDPQGDGSENNSNASKVLDGDASTAWRTEGYDPPGFSGKKNGVGLGLYLASRSLVEQIDVDGSTNGWSAKVFVIDAASLDGFDPNAAEAAGFIKNVKGPVSLPLDVSAAKRTGSIVLIWITDLGSAGDDGRYRVAISSVALMGTPAT